MSDLLVYKASAGSGKTYQLTRTYLLMLYRDPVAYRTILAVTFTNKAAGEMKARILESLYRLANGDPTVEEYRIELMRETGRTPADITRLAREILTTILNDYSSFYVSTIDKFFQMVIRGFVREIGLQSGYNLELNSDRILTEAVDRMMAGLDKNEWLCRWLVKFADERIFAGKPWDPNKDIFRLGTEVFKEKYREIFDQPASPESFGELLEGYTANLAETVNGITGHLRKTGGEAIKAIEEAGLGVDDFAYKSAGVAGYLKNLAEQGVVPPTKRALAANEDPDKWYSSGSPVRDVIVALTDRVLAGKLRHAVEYYDENVVRYNTANAIYKNIFAFGILNNISLNIREVVNEKNIFLLSDATFFLKKIVDGNPTPFIYEKSGNYFSHFMLDEFQDTSGFQWQNFAPLIDNALSQGNKNLIVGDVKQSIYRWRNSDWMILAREVESYFRKYVPDVEPLTENWRSHENIVRFNNTLFHNAAEIVSMLVKNDSEEASAGASFSEGWTDLVSGIYRDAMQSVPGKYTGTGGHVSVGFREAASNEEYTLWLKDTLPGIIKGIQDRGYAARDITILVRTGTEGRVIANLLMDEMSQPDGRYNFNVISNDSLYLNANPAVNFLAALLGYLKNPADQINLGFIRHEFMRYLVKDPEPLSDMNTLFMNLNDQGDFHRVFGRFYGEFDQIRILPLYELSERLIDIFELNLDTENLSYIQAFQDIVLDFVRNETSDINAFLDYWEKSGSSATLGISEAQDAIRIMTIHKAKGLQFKTVIIPFCHWSLTPDTKGSKDLYLWCSTEGTGFEPPGHVPVKYHRDLLNSAFRMEYLNEKFHSYIDNLNLLYVASTRAEEELYILAKKDRDTSKQGNTGNLLFEILSHGHQPPGSYPSLDPEKYFDTGSQSFFFGTPHTAGTGVRAEGKKDTMETVFLNSYPITHPGDKLKLNSRNAYLSQMQEDVSQALGYGTVMHEILAGIRTQGDLEHSVMRAFSQGKISRGQRTEILALLQERLAAKGVTEWFDRRYQVRTEQDLVLAGRGILRPDRVVYLDDHIAVVDYKFGLRQDPAHFRQVHEYMSALEDIEHRPVRGFVWYFTPGRIEEVSR